MKQCNGVLYLIKSATCTQLSTSTLGTIAIITLKDFKTFVELWFMLHE